MPHARQAARTAQPGDAFAMADAENTLSCRKKPGLDKHRAKKRQGNREVG
jgi:hypothetical protein